MANTMKSPPPAYLITRSGILSPRCPDEHREAGGDAVSPTAPATTPKGDAAAESALSR